MGNLGLMLIGITDILIASKHSIYTLGAISIANAIVFCIYIVGIGLLSSISIVLSNYRGDKKPTKLFLPTVINFSLILSLILGTVCLLTVPLIDYMGFEQNLVQIIKDYIFISSFSFFGMYLYQSLKEFLQAHEIVFVPNIILIFAVFLNLVLNIILVFGFKNFNGFGAIGLAYATFISRTFMGVSLLFYLFKIVKQKCFFNIDFVKQLIKIGYPIGIALMLEFLGFNIITILMGKLNGIYAATHTIIIQIISIAYMIPLALSNALAIKIGYYNGSKDYYSLLKYSKTGTYMSVFVMLCFGITFFMFPKEIISIFSSNNEILKLGVPILIIASIFEIADGYQVSLSGILKGLKMTKTVSACVISGYWLFGIPLGFILCYKFNMLLKGFWIGLAISFVCIGIIESIIVLYKFNKLKKIY
ncbi:MAG: hypothetical protein BHW64_03700 [Candidatus Melainabacteria bacterium LEY3_CP_29_8]|nr:MAG: hypothetical protein BHW64_03700 [Candidatus Melainabacteria bacterium LEY3_CP_29_8]